MIDSLDGHRAIVTVVGVDRVGIIAGISTLLAEHRVNILDISMTVLDEFFAMILIADLAAATVDFSTLLRRLNEKGQELGVQVTIQREEIFKRMHRI